VTAFLAAMARDGDPGAGPLPGTAGGATGWPVTPGGDGGRSDGVATCWLDTDGRWWWAGPDGAVTSADRPSATVDGLDGLCRALDHLLSGTSGAPAAG
jgi:hypothetical protein